MPRLPNKAKSSDEWQTPPELFAVLQKKLGINFRVDAAATAKNALVRDYITRRQDALSRAPWASRGQWAWLNPPFSELSDFVDAVVHQYVNNGIRTVMIAPGHRCEQAWFGKVLAHTSIVLFPVKRVRYNRPDGTKANSPTFPSMILVVDGFECFGVKGFPVVRVFNWR